MGFRINTNIAALNAHTNATMNNRNLDSSLGKLSSGLRINTAADDASGLTIANSLRSQASSLGQAVSNGNDAVGLLQTADGALSEYANILDTIKTKSVQAASDGQNTASRLAIQKDVDALMEELNVIATTTSFNGQKLLSGTFANKEFQMGANANESVNVNIGSTETSQIGQTTRGDLTIDKLGENQLTLRSATTGKELTLDPIDIQYDNTAESGMGGVAAQINKYSGETGITAKAIVKSDTGVIAGGTTSADFAINGITIGSIQVDADDAGGTLQNAINSKTNETGVTATRTTDGKLELNSSDGRAIKVTDLVNTNGTATVANTDAEMTTVGFLDIVQAGSSDFKIEGAAYSKTTAGVDMTITGTTSILQDSKLEKTSSIAVGSQLVAGQEIGTLITATVGMSLVTNSSTADMTLGKDSVLKAGSKINKDTEITTQFTIASANTLSATMILGAGSILTTGSVLDAGTVLAEDMQFAGNTYKAGTTLGADITLTSARTLAKDMTMFVDLDNANAAIATGSTLAVGTVVGMDVVNSADVTLADSMILKTGSVIAESSTMAKGSQIGQSITITAAAIVTSGDMILKEGTSLTSGSIIDQGSEIGANVKVRANAVLLEDMTLAEGSVLTSGTVLKKGTVLTQDLTADQVNTGAGIGLKAGQTLNVDLTLTDPVVLTEELTLLKGSTVFAGSDIAANANGNNSVKIENKEFTALSDIDVTTLEGAMNAIDTLSAAITNLDTIRSGIGSAQNQVVSTINNISVTQVNVKAAESNLRDVDFAAESANFSKFNILAQSGSYAMSQANAVQQNVMRLLQ